MEDFAHFALLCVLRYIETIENRVRFFRYGSLHRPMHQVDQPLMMIDHFAEEALIGITRREGGISKSCRGLRVESRLRERRRTKKTNAARCQPDAPYFLAVSHIGCVHRPARRSQTPLTAESTTIAVIAAQPEVVIGMVTSIISAVA